MKSSLKRRLPNEPRHLPERPDRRGVEFRKRVGNEPSAVRILAISKRFRSVQAMERVFGIRERRVATAQGNESIANFGQTETYFAIQHQVGALTGITPSPPRLATGRGGGEEERKGMLDYKKLTKPQIAQLEKLVERHVSAMADEINSSKLPVVCLRDLAQEYVMATVRVLGA